MQRVYRSTRAAALPAPPAQAVSPGYFTAGDPGLGIPATVPGYEWFNGIQEEIAFVIETNGLTLDRLDHTLLYDAIAAQINSRLSAIDAFTYKGVVDCSANPNYPAASAGDTYKVSVAGKIGGGSGPNVQVGDMLICTTDGTSSGTHAAVGANWNIIQVNIDGAVVGPTSATSGHLVRYDGITGKLVDDSGVATSTDGTLASNSDAKLPTEKAVKTYVDAATGSIVAPGWVLLDTKTASASASLDFTSYINDTYHTYVFVFDNLLGSAAGVTPLLRASTNGGSSYVDTGSLYQTVGLGDDAAGNQLWLCHTTSGVLGNEVNGAINGQLWMYEPSSALHKRFLNQLFHEDNSNTYRSGGHMGSFKSTTAVNAIRFLPQTGGGTWVSGSIRMYGVRKV